MQMMMMMMMMMMVMMMMMTFHVCIYCYTEETDSTPSLSDCMRPHTYICAAELSNALESLRCPLQTLLDYYPVIVACYVTTAQSVGRMNTVFLNGQFNYRPVISRAVRSYCCGLIKSDYCFNYKK